MTQNMEVDFDVPKFLYEERQKTSPQLQHYFATFEDLYERKLWHQLTTKILEFFEESESASHQLPIFQNFVAEWEDKIKKLSLVTIALKAAKQFTDLQESVNFLNEIVKKVDEPETKDVYVLAVMESAYFKLKLNQEEEVKKAIEESEKILDTFDSVEPSIYASYYRVSSEYYKAKANYAQYYKSSLLYLSCVEVEELPERERVERAYDLSISALLGEMIYNFGELLMHPILQSLQNTEFDFLRSVLYAFTTGEIGKYEALSARFNEVPILLENQAALSRKLCLMTLIEAVFKRSTDNRSIPFKDIAQETRLPSEEVEHLVMKALSLNLIRGSIDQVDEVVVVTWVQPRVLEMDQIDGMRRKLEAWDDQVKRISSFVGTQGGEVFAQ